MSTNPTAAGLVTAIIRHGRCPRCGQALARKQRYAILHVRLCLKMPRPSRLLDLNAGGRSVAALAREYDCSVSWLHRRLRLARDGDEPAQIPVMPAAEELPPKPARHCSHCGVGVAANRLEARATRIRLVPHVNLAVEADGELLCLGCAGGDRVPPEQAAHFIALTAARATDKKRGPLVRASLGKQPHTQNAVVFAAPL